MQYGIFHYVAFLTARFRNFEIYDWAQKNIGARGDKNAMGNYLIVRMSNWL